MLRFTLVSLVLAVLAGCQPPPPAVPPEQAAAAAPQAKTPEAVPVAPAVALPAPERILADAVEAVGGRERLAAVRSYYLEDVMDAPTHKFSATSRVWWKDGRFYAETEAKNIGRSRVWGGPDGVWSDDPIHGRRKLEGEEAEQHRRDSALNLAADWSRYFARARTQARREQDGRTLLDVVLTTAAGQEVTLSFDEQSHLLVEQRFDEITPTGTTPVVLRFDEYQELDGILYPTRQVMDLSVISAVQTVVKLETNLEIDDALFEPELP